MGSVRPKREIDSSLCGKGFERTEGGKHIQYFLTGFPRIRTLMSRGAMGETINAKLIGDMARQLSLTKEQFLALIDCTLDESGYLEFLREQGHIT